MLAFSKRNMPYFWHFPKKMEVCRKYDIFFNGRRWWCREAVPPPPVTGVKKCQKNYECHIFGKSQKDSSWQNENVGILIEKYAIFVEFKNKVAFFTPIGGGGSGRYYRRWERYPYFL
ncbi:unnamed protein product [Cuscuta epithymum]|uniref:Uncharacterized protein n=1 Tax=Cuscuta epithymum TaxID=186058 RepID=A0AAV0EGX7_9ASTE|nr:unnamed protein product [Cuscuta epithymum]